MTAGTRAVLICTKDRPRELSQALEAIAREQAWDLIVVVDASTTPVTKGLCDDFVSREAYRTLVYEHHAPGISAQRNRAIELALKHDPSLDLLCFIDDDIIVQPGFFREIDRLFGMDTLREVAAVAGTYVEDRDRPSGLVGEVWHAVKRIFLLDGRPGAILPSGRNIPIYEAPGPVVADWLQTGACCFRADVLRDYRFDDRLQGYSWGEDFDLTFRIGRDHVLVQTPHARATHLLAEGGRVNAETLTRGRTVLLHAWVRENRRWGLSTMAFWWSVFGEALLTAALTAVRRRPTGPAELRGIYGAVIRILREGSTRNLELR